MKLHISVNSGIAWGQKIVLTGSVPELGNWDPQKSIVLQRVEKSVWTADIKLSKRSKQVAYKFCLLPPTGDDAALIAWENSGNHVLDLSQLSENQTIHHDYITFQFPQKRWKAAGVSIPVFSLRSEKSFGIGEFTDLLPFIDWAQQTGMQLIQLLPINDTTQTHTWVDSYPYNAISIFALHPLYLNLDAIGQLKDADRQRFYQQKQKELNPLISVDYEEVDHLKWSFFREIFAQEGQNVLHSPEYIAFAKENGDWLAPYAEYSAKRDQESHPDLYRFLQFHAHKQMSEVRNYAHEHGIFLKGDIPIGISRDSVEALVEPEYFNMNFQAGAPPDAFSATGQIWGFPTYNWQAMEADNYRWWKRRFQKMADYFDAYRIDHILGFFRIWQVPLGAQSGLEGRFNPALPYSRKDIEWSGLPLFTLSSLFIEDDKQAGYYHPKISVWDMPEFQQLYEHDKQIFYGLYNEYFYRRHNEFWKSEALKHLTPLVNATDMLVCGEDLGMIPETVPDVMNQLKILSLEIERMPKSAEQTFTPLHRLPYLSVCTTSTHDMSVVRAWWKEDRAQTQRYYNEVLWKSGAAPEDCTPELAEQIVVNHLSSPAMLVVIPWQDWLSVDGQLRYPDSDAERINVPAHSRHYWRYRMHLSVEQLLKAKKLNEKINNLITSTRK
ncbi:hypothetical protein FACS189413_08270 [Bacteroidia bacterium]|nr:hypothetical protein FACS189413_08270 [Bacteroidia bacterium]